MPVSNIICTGDVVAYCADAAGCVTEMRDWGLAYVAGNCEKQLAAGATDCGCGFDEGTVCDALSARWFAHASAQIGQEDRDWMAQCPDIVTFRHADLSCSVIHGGVTEIARFIWPVSEEHVFTSEIAALNAALSRQGMDPVDRVYASHCGIVFERQIQDVHWVNASVIGMPPHDGRPETRFVTVSSCGDLNFKNLTYHFEKTSEKMFICGLRQGYQEALRTGFWPSEDVLPKVMRRG